MKPAICSRYFIIFTLTVLFYSSNIYSQSYPIVPADMIQIRKEMKAVAAADVYSKSEWNYVINEGKVTTNKYKSRVIKFDKLGRIIEIIKLSPKGENQSVIVCKYDNNNYPVQETEFLTTGEMIGRTKYTYDSKGRLKDITWLNGFEFIVNRKTFDIDENKDIVTEWQYYSPDSVSGKTNYLYTNLLNGVVIKQNNYSGDHQLENSIVYHRDTSQIIIKEEIRDASEKLVCYHNYQYSKKGLLQQIVVQLPNNAIVPKYVYDYDDDGLLAGILEYDERGNIIDYKKYTYE